MPYIPNNKYKEIYQSSKDGNEKALAIIQALRKGNPQEDLDQLLNAYYDVPAQDDLIQSDDVIREDVVKEDDLIQEQEDNVIKDVVEDEVIEPIENEDKVIDMTSVLDKETEGLFDENEINGIGFDEFLANKSKNTLRGKKNADYFKSFNPQDRANYLNSKIDNYKAKFDGNLSDIERKYNDMVLSLDAYSKDVALMLDDDIDLDMNKTASCYDDLINDKNTMRSFGRFWDQNDNQIMNDKLSSLKDTYGKQNVIAALNTLRNDNDAYRDFSNNQIDQEISRYSKSITDLLK